MKLLTRTLFSSKEQAQLLKRLAFLLCAQLSIIDALTIVIDQTRNRKKTAALMGVREAVLEGKMLSDSLLHHKVVDEFIANVLHMGEMNGLLVNNLEHLSEELHKKQLLQQKILSALLYPLCITAATIGLACALTIYIFPKLMPIFVSLHVSLPLTTRALLSIAVFLQQFGILLACIIAALVVIFLLARAHNAALRYFTDRLLLSVPIVGKLVRTYNIAQCTRALNGLLSSGIEIPEALERLAQATHNKVYASALHSVSEAHTRGERLSITIANYPTLFEDMVVHMLAVGEASSSVGNSFGYLAQHYETEFDTMTKNLSSSIEPALMICLGLLVGTIALSVIAPIYSITNHLNVR